MEKQQRFAVGERVRTIQATTTVPRNVLGTVQIVFFDADLYSVCFDGLDGFYLVHHVELAQEELEQHTFTADTSHAPGFVLPVDL